MNVETHEWLYEDVAVSLTPGICFTRSTKDLLERLVEGDPGVADELISRYRPRLRKWVETCLPLSLVATLDVGSWIPSVLRRGVDSARARGLTDPVVFVTLLRRSITEALLEVRRVSRWAADSTGYDDAPSHIEDRVACRTRRRNGAGNGKVEEES